MLKALGKSAFVANLLGGMIWLYMVVVARTVRWRIEGLEHIEPLLRADKAMVVLAWHSRMLMMPVLQSKIVNHLPKRSHKSTVIVSQSRDGGISNAACGLLGLHIIRASTARKDRPKSKGAVGGARQALQALRDRAMVAITVDGPRGPAEVVQPGPVKLAQQGGTPILAFGLSAAAKRLDTWDRVMVPIPFSRGALVFSAPVTTTKDMDSGHLCTRMEALLVAANRRAAELAGQVDEPVRRPSGEGASAAEIGAK